MIPQSIEMSNSRSSIASAAGTRFNYLSWSGKGVILISIHRNNNKSLRRLERRRALDSSFVCYTKMMQR